MHAPPGALHARAQCPLPSHSSTRPSQHSEKEHAELEGMLIAAVLAAREGDVPALLREMEGAQKARAVEQPAACC